EDGRRMGLQGMINTIIRESDFDTLERAGTPSGPVTARVEDHGTIARMITAAEKAGGRQEVPATSPDGKRIPVIGITGAGGAGKSSLTDEIVRRYILDFPQATVAVLAVDPSISVHGGATLGDRIRINSASNDRVFMRSIATRDSQTELPDAVWSALAILKQAGFDLIIVETPGVGQWNRQITEVADVSLYAMTREYGAELQLEKHNMLWLADLVVLNKFERQGSLDALRAVRKQVQRNKRLFAEPLEKMPVYATIASRFNDPGVNGLYAALLAAIQAKTGVTLTSAFLADPLTKTEIEDITRIIPPERGRYLAEISDSLRHYKKWSHEQAGVASRVWQLDGTLQTLAAVGKDEQRRKYLFGANGTAGTNNDAEHATAAVVAKLKDEADRLLHPRCKQLIDEWPQIRQQYSGDEFVYQVRDREFRVPLTSESLSHLHIPRVVLPQFRDPGEVLRWRLLENVPGEFPYTAGVFPLKRKEEDPIRMFAGEGGPEKTNKRFHLLAEGAPFTRLSTAFDSVTLYGEDPDRRPDIWGKIGNAGVAISTLDDAKRLYSGFDLCDPQTSVSMTINGPAPIILAFFMNTAVDQLCETWLRENGKLDAVKAWREQAWKSAGVTGAPTYRGDNRDGKLPRGHNGTGLALLGTSGSELVEAGLLPADVYATLRARALSTVRGTVQADILKEDQAQNTCIFSTEFALRMMGDVQQYFVDQNVRNFYSVSISGYHIAEAGANPITQLALTLANGFTYAEYYRARGMDVDAYAPNLSFFFSNGLDPEYTVIGRVARRIWAVAMRELYKGNDRSQKLKYHIQTSGRSLHAQEISFNDIRTTLQALTAINDNCNSLHTNAYDEAITTPTEESVRRAVAIQMIVNHELGLTKNENSLQGSYFVELLTELVEEAVLDLFTSISERGGVLGAMETGFQRARIQEESLYYEHLKNNGKLPLIGVNTFIDPASLEADQKEPELRRSSEDEKEDQLAACNDYNARFAARQAAALQKLQHVALTGGNIFGELMETVKVASLGQISRALYAVGGQYRRNM
ncbi:MAG: methylmalonyl-CoA mutase family protein, partial [Planctomycetota bacterium]